MQKYSIPQELQDALSPRDFEYGLSSADCLEMSGSELSAHGAKSIIDHFMKTAPAVERHHGELKLVWGPFWFTLPPESDTDRLTDDPIDDAEAFIRLSPPDIEAAGVF